MSSIARSQGKNSSSKTFFLFPLHREICQLEISNIINLSTNNERTNNDGVKAKINYVFRSSFSFMALLRTLHCSLDKISFQLAMKWREFFCNSRDKLISVYVRTYVRSSNTPCWFISEAEKIIKARAAMFKRHCP